MQSLDDQNLRTKGTPQIQQNHFHNDVMHELDKILMVLSVSRDFFSKHTAHPVSKVPYSE